MSEEIKKSTKIINLLEKYSIGLILFLSFILRFIRINHGLPYLYGLDEYFIVDPTIHMLVAKDFNPHWFGHPGSFVMYLLAILFFIIRTIIFIYQYSFGNISDFKGFAQLSPNDWSLLYFYGRLLMVFFAVTTVYLVYLIGKRLFNKHIGLLAALCLSIAPLHIEYSSWIRTDIAATMLIMLSVFIFFSFIEQGKNIKLLALASLFSGFAIAAKYTSVIMIFPILVYCLKSDSKEVNLLTGKYIINSLRIRTNLSRALLFIFIGFFIFAPFVILDFRHAVRNIFYEIIGPRACRERLPGLQTHLWYLNGPLKKGIGGVFFEILAGIGLFWVLFKKLKKQYLFIFFPILYFLAVGCALFKESRWLMPILPFESVLFGVGLYSSYQFLIQIRNLHNFKPKIILLFAIMLISASLPLAVNDLKDGIKLNRPDTRTLAKDWIENNLPSGSKIAYEIAASLLHINPKNDFVLINTRWAPVVSKPLTYYKNQSVDYIVIADIKKKRYYSTSNPNKYAAELSRYEELENTAKLIKVFENKENPGPKVFIYKLR